MQESPSFGESGFQCGEQVMHKSTLNEGKQVEHIVNERKILGAAEHPFCVRLMRALQDSNELYLLQEFIGGRLCA